MPCLARARARRARPAHTHTHTPQLTCLPSTVVEHMGVIFLMATLPPVSLFLAAHTTPYAPLPSALMGTYLRSTLNTVPITSNECLPSSDAIFFSSSPEFFRPPAACCVGAPSPRVINGSPGSRAVES